MTDVASRKSMTEGELAVLLSFSALALLALVGAAKAEDAAFAFHCFLTAAASVAVVFGTFNRYFDRPADPPAREIGGRPNYNFAPIKVATIFAWFGASPDSWSGYGRRWSSPGRRSTSICRGSI